MFPYRFLFFYVCILALPFKTESETQPNHVIDFGGGSCVEGPGRCDGGSFSTVAGRFDLSCAATKTSGEPRLVFERLRSIVPAANPAGASGCFQYSLELQPKWISSATWIEARSRIMVVDPRSDTVFLYSYNGSSSGLLPKELTNNETVDSSAKTAASYLLKLSGHRALILDNQLTRIKKELDIGRKRDGNINGLGALYNWVTAGNQLFAVGTFHQLSSASPNNYQVGFLRAQLEGEATSVGDVELVRPFDFSPYYTLGQKYVAANDDSAFFLAMKDSAELYAIGLSPGQELRKLTAVPAEFLPVPKLPEATGVKDAPKVFDAIERNSSIAGIYGYGRMLYLLARSPSGTQTKWWLYQIDPRQDKVIGRVLLPTSAHHVTVVPSPSSWFVFEKGPVEAGGQQKIESLVAIPTNWVVNIASSPLSEHNNKATGTLQCQKKDKKKST